MGILSFLKGDSSSNAKNSDLTGHQIDPSTVLAPTDPNVPNPRNPGRFASVRSTPVLQDPRYFNAEEIKALKTLIKGKKANAKATSEGYASLKQLDDIDATVHGAHYSYQEYLAKNEVKKLATNAKYAEALHGLRTSYASLGAGLDEADQKAQLKIQAIKSKLQSQRTRTSSRTSTGTSSRRKSKK
ncbi:MAG: hypothetical protein ACFBSC_12005 [Microcoleaceae cyanobacterium]